MNTLCDVSEQESRFVDVDFSSFRSMFADKKIREPIDEGMGGMLVRLRLVYRRRHDPDVSLAEWPA